MPNFTVPNSAFFTGDVYGKKSKLMSKEAFDEFSIGVLGLGDVATASRSIDTISAVFDLAGFTNFCKQIEPQLSVPYYLNAFLNWLMEQIKKETRQAETSEGVSLWCPLPFFVKFLGDGLLVLWDCSEMNTVAQRNVLMSLNNICRHYRTRFLPDLRSKIVDAPPALRCGAARGTVFSVGSGSGQDYVGSCINMAARLQKLPGLSFCFNRRGFDLEGFSPHEFYTKSVVVKQVSIRGIGDHELICMLASEDEALSAEDRAFYREV